MTIKTLIIGLDGLDLDLTKKWIGDLPNLRHLINDGSWGYLKSSIPPMSVPAWQWFSTGKQGGKTGVYGFAKRKTTSYAFTPINSTDNRSNNLWNYLDDKGYAVGVINVPLTYPPESLKHGFIVSGIPCPPNTGNLNFTYPPELSVELNSLYDDLIYEIDIILKSNWSDLKGQELLNEIQKIMKRRTQAINYLIEEKNCDFLIVVYGEIDRVSHLLWNDKEKLKQVYQQQDEELGKLLKKVSEDTNIIVLSDHGFGPGEGKFHVNSWLKEKGYLVLNKETTITYNLLSSFGVTTEKVLNFFNKFNLGFITNYFPNKIKDMIPQHTLPSLMDADVNWKETKAYAHGEVGVIYINLKGREPEGIVNKGREYHDVMERLIEELKQIKHPKEEKKLVSTIWKKEDVFNGKFIDHAPDIVFMMDDLKYSTNKTFIDGTFFSEGPQGEHRLNGTFIIKGEGVLPNKKIEASILDLFPTILYLHDLPIPSDLDGKILKDIFTESKEAVHEKSKGKEVKDFAWTEEEEREIKGRLRKLGYLT